MYTSLRSIAAIAQLVEQRTENPRVPGSSPGRGTLFCRRGSVVEQLTRNEQVRGSNPRVGFHYLHTGLRSRIGAR